MIFETSYKNISEFISFLEENNELIRITEPVSWDLEITEIVQRVFKQEGPALLFENVADSDMPVLINGFGTRKRMSWALGVEDLDEIGDRITKLLSNVQGAPPGIFEKIGLLKELLSVARIGPKKTKTAPSQETVILEDELDLMQLPILKTWPLDGGRYITLPLVITKDPETGVHNIGMYRMQVFDKKTTGMHWQTQKVGKRHQALELKKGTPRMEVAVALGADPALIWSASAPLACIP